MASISSDGTNFMPGLTEQEQQDIIRFVEADKPLPDKYRFLLFEDKREVELVWNGKTSEVCNIVLPLPGHRAGRRTAGGEARRRETEGRGAGPALQPGRARPGNSRAGATS
jgi:hypothetical protein